MNFKTKLITRTRAIDSMLCVGLDPDIGRFPQTVRTGADPIYDFCRAIVDATAQYACAFKPQIAYFAAESAEQSLLRIITYIKENHPDIPVILDAKRGDIGSTAKQYAREAFERYGADALTVNPYMGFDTIEPYMGWKDRGLFLLCRTSNPGGKDIEELDVGGELLYQRVARMTQTNLNGDEQMGLVVGATQPNEIARVREVAPDLPFLVPGIGAQGGDVFAAVKAGIDRDGGGLVINSSRAILYAGKDADFAQESARVAMTTRDAIRAARDAAV